MQGGPWGTFGKEKLHGAQVPFASSHHEGRPALLVTEDHVTPCAQEQPHDLKKKKKHSGLHLPAAR